MCLAALCSTYTCHLSLTKLTHQDLHLYGDALEQHFDTLQHHPLTASRSMLLSGKS